MTLQHWAFSFKGRIGRRDFWVGFGLCFVLFLGLFVVNEHYALPAIVTWGVFLLITYPFCAIFTKRLHDRNKRGGWLLLLLLAMLLAFADTSGFEPFWQWGVGRFLPSFIFTVVFLDCGVFASIEGENAFGHETETVNYKQFR